MGRCYRAKCLASWPVPGNFLMSSLNSSETNHAARSRLPSLSTADRKNRRCAASCRRETERYTKPTGVRAQPACMRSTSLPRARK
eukprot:scaffold101552_cov63-Phaeocystis_antarctica.AAC.1